MADAVLITLADENYVEQAKQLFSSVYWRGGWRGDYLLLAHGLSKEQTAWFTNKGILVYDCQPLTETPIGTERYSPSVASKFYVFALYFKKWKQVVFLDADIIVRSSLESLAKTEKFSAPEAMFLNLRGEFKNADSAAWKTLQESYSVTGNAFNSGVFSFPTTIVDERTFIELVDIFKKFAPVSRFGEEAALNLYFQNKWTQLSQIYNINPGLLTRLLWIRSKNIRGTILHFVASVKPWKQRSPFRAEWLANYKKAEYIDLTRQQPAGVTLTPEETKKYLTLIAYRTRILRFYYFAVMPLFFVEKMVGQVGLAIKRRWPRLYDKISLNK